eukprot:498208-Alexandrium_andersonii.AAC.1
MRPQPALRAHLAKPLMTCCSVARSWMHQSAGASSWLAEASSPSKRGLRGAALIERAQKMF